MTQELMTFFIEYQIPTDLISYSILADASAPMAVKVQTVREHMEAMTKMVTQSNEKAQKVRWSELHGSKFNVSLFFPLFPH
jgi:hypothetical protein